MRARGEPRDRTGRWVEEGCRINPDESKAYPVHPFTSFAHTQTQLNDRYVFDVTTQLKWKVDAAGCAVMTVDSEVAADVDPPLIFRTIPRPVLTKLGTEVMKLALRKVEGSL